MIQVSNVSKSFKVRKLRKDPTDRIMDLVIPKYEERIGVNGINFDIHPGEIVGYVGPNGAGKSTTIKMLTGILTPTEGTIRVNNIVPYINRRVNARQIGVVFGQRSQLYWDLPMKDTFDLHQKMYEIPDNVFRRNVSLFIEILEMEQFLNQPVRQLSLGQKMRANIALSLLHDPAILYLDEPTIGLDIVAKDRIREFLCEVNRTKNTTIILTTHDMNDIEQVCKRLMLIDKGIIRYDGSIEHFKEEYGEHYSVHIKTAIPVMIEIPNMQIVKIDDRDFIVTGNKHDLSISTAVTQLVKRYPVTHIDIRERNIESILKDLYRTK